MQHPDIYSDFNYWIELAQQDPEAFEQIRQNLIAKEIEQSSGHQQLQLKQLQWRIDGIRRRYKDSADKNKAFMSVLQGLLKKQQQQLLALTDKLKASRLL